MSFNHGVVSDSFCDLTDCNSPVSSVYEIYQARILKWIAISYSRGSSRPGDRTHCLLHWQADSESPGKLNFCHYSFIILNCSLLSYIQSWPCVGRQRIQNSSFSKTLWYATWWLMVYMRDISFSSSFLLDDYSKNWLSVHQGYDLE